MPQILSTHMHTHVYTQEDAAMTFENCNIYGLCIQNEIKHVMHKTREQTKKKRTILPVPNVKN